MTTEGARLFLEFDYAETRDLLKAFITLISGVLVLSVSFHDRVVGRDADRPARRLMLATWALLFLALVLAGVALAAIAFAAACAIYGSDAFPLLTCGVGALGLTAWLLILAAGGAFVSAFATMILAARRALMIDTR